MGRHDGQRVMEKGCMVGLSALQPEEKSEV